MPTEFKRLCGVTPEIFLEMVKVIAAEKVLAKKSGRPSKWCLSSKCAESAVKPVI